MSLSPESLSSESVQNAIALGGILKKCSGCQKDLELKAFSKRKASKDGLCPECKACHSLRSARFGITHAKEIRRYREAYKARNREKLNAAQKIYSRANPEKVRKYKKGYYAINREKVEASHKIYAAAHAEQEKARSKKWRNSNPEKLKILRRKSKQKIRGTPQGALDARMGCAVRQSLISGAKNGREWESLVGYTVAQLKAHLELLFMAGMSWENRGLWHIDHRIPKSFFRYETPEDEAFKQCWALSNLQPLWAEVNLKKHASLDWLPFFT